MKFKTILGLIFLLVACFSFNAVADKIGKKGLSATVDNATSVPFTPTGNIAATNVGAALGELDTEKQAKILSGSVSHFGLEDTAINIVGQSNGTTNLVNQFMTTTGVFDTGIDNAGANNGTIRNNTGTTRKALLIGSVSLTSSTSGNVWVVGVLEGASIIPACSVITNFSGAETASFSCVVTAAAGDEYSIGIGNLSSTDGGELSTYNLQMILL